MSEWYKENSVFVWMLIIALCVIVFGAVYSSTLREIASKFMRRVRPLLWLALHPLYCCLYWFLRLDSSWQVR